MSTWKLNKTIPFGDGEARFYTLYEDVRDVMCDSLVPDWRISDRAKNRKVEVFDRIKREYTFSKEVTKEEGNAMYKEMAKLDRNGYGRWDCKEWIRKNKMLTVEGVIKDFELNGWKKTVFTCPDGAMAMVSPCSYVDVKSVTDCDYFLIDWDMPWGGEEKIEKLVEVLNKHEEMLKQNKDDKEELRRYFDEHQKNGWDDESFGTYSDWHKDLFGYRPHGYVFGKYVRPY